MRGKDLNTRTENWAGLTASSALAACLNESETE